MSTVICFGCCVKETDEYMANAEAKLPELTANKWRGAVFIDVLQRVIAKKLRETPGSRVNEVTEPGCGRGGH